MRGKKLPALLLAFALLFALPACNPAAENPSAAPSQAASQALPSAAPSSQPSETPSNAAPYGPIRLAVLSGPTGIGAARLIDIAKNNPVDLHTTYECGIFTDNSELVAGLTGPDPEFDIATVASNVAANLYNKTDGGVRIIAAGTLGVLHILESGSKTEINSMADLAGRTIYAAGQGANPEYILRYLLQENELDDVEVVFAGASEISAKLLSGEIECAMLPVPAATAAILKSEGKVRQAIDLTEAWDGLKNGSQLIMTAVVVRTEFAEAYPEQVDAFLTEYKESIDYVNNNVDAAAEIIAALGITPSASIAKQAIPQCHLAFLSGTEMVAGMSDYYSVLYSIDPAAVGGVLPDGAIYWVPAA